MAISADGVACAADTETRLAKIEAMATRYHRSYRDVPEVDVPGYLALAGSRDVVLVDVRPEAERAVSILPGAIPLAVVEADLAAFQGRVVVTYCTIGYRSGIAAASLRAQGIDARNLRGSILAWTHAGGALEGPDGPTRQVHVYGARWNLVADGYKALW